MRIITIAASIAARSIAMAWPPAQAVPWSPYLFDSAPNVSRNQIYYSDAFCARATSTPIAYKKGLCAVRCPPSWVRFVEEDCFFLLAGHSETRSLRLKRSTHRCCKSTRRRWCITLWDRRTIPEGITFGRKKWEVVFPERVQSAKGSCLGVSGLEYSPCAYEPTCIDIRMVQLLYLSSEYRLGQGGG